MALSFPLNPTTGQTYQSGSSSTYQWNGTYWATILPPTQIFVTAQTASFVATSSTAISSSRALTASFATTASFIATASYATSALTASHALTASYVQPVGGGSVLVQVTGSWSIPTGGNTNVSFSVDQNKSYMMWMYGNIPNGIVSWNANCTISNSNVNVVGAQYAWVYNGGGTPIDIISLPDQFIGTSGSIIRSTGAGLTQPTNTFRFTLRNTSGTAQTFYYGYTQM
jgi:hypothetical protein